MNLYNDALNVDKASASKNGRGSHQVCFALGVDDMAMMTIVVRSSIDFWLCKLSITGDSKHILIKSTKY